MVQDTNLMHRVPLWLFQQRNNPCYTSLLIFSGGLRRSLTLLLHLVISLCITTSAPCHHSLTAKSAPLQLSFELLHEIYFLQQSQAKAVRKFLFSCCGGFCWKPNSSPVFSASSGLISSGGGVFCEQGEKKSIGLLGWGSCLAPIIKYLMH